MKNALALALLLAGCGGTINYDYAHEPDPRKTEYVIGVADQLKIQVWKNPELSTEARVRPDGTITLPLIGDVAAAGKRPSTLKDEVVQRLAAFVKEAAVVTIAVTDPNSYRVMLSGNVEHPGVYTAKYYLTVAEAIALAGGPNKFAGSYLLLVRSDGNKRIPIDYARIRSGQHPDENLALFSGDTIFIP